MMKTFGFPMMLAVVASPVLAGGSVSTNRHFSAEVTNLRRTSTGKTLVTVTFKSRVREGESVSLYAGTQDCASSATLIDADGNEQGTTRCMSVITFQNGDSTNFSGPGQHMDGPSSTTFVYQFATKQPDSIQPLAPVDMVVPIMYKYCVNVSRPSNNGGNINEIICRLNTVTLSFDGLLEKPNI